MFFFNMPFKLGFDCYTSECEIVLIINFVTRAGFRSNIACEHIPCISFNLSFVYSLRLATSFAKGVSLHAGVYDEVVILSLVSSLYLRKCGRRTDY